eukprot:COSAG04_NODE_156_length_22317_cov_10.513954_6_plen_138_part_00
MPGLRALALLAAAASASAKGGSSSGSGSGSGSVAPGSAPPPPGEVWTLHDKQDFVRAVKSADVLFVNFFFAVGCHFSDELQPEWDAAAKLLAEAGVDATMARVRPRPAAPRPARLPSLRRAGGHPEEHAAEEHVRRV